MSARDELAHLLFVTDNSGARDVEAEWRAAGGKLLIYIYAMADALIAAGYRKPQTITTAEDIRELPALTMVVYDDMAAGGPLEAYVVPDDGTVMFKDCEEFHLLCMNGDYVDAKDMPLPLTIVYESGA